MTAIDWTSETMGAGEYADLNGLRMYYETHGTGRPLVLLHGGLASSEMFGPIIPALAESHQVIAPDLQGHGRTADVDRPIDLGLMADDIAALIDHLGLEKPDVVGYSLGGGVAMQTAVKYPDKVRKLVVASQNLTPDALDPALRAQQVEVNAAAAEFMQDTPMYKLYQKVAPRPEDFGRLLDKIGELMKEDYDHTEVVRGSRCRRSSSTRMPTWRRRAMRSRCSSCSMAACATAAGWARTGRRAGTPWRSCRA